jgi:hypothetical protein
MPRQHCLVVAYDRAIALLPIAIVMSCACEWICLQFSAHTCATCMQVKHYQGDVSDLCLTFSVEEDFFGQTTTVGGVWVQAKHSSHGILQGSSLSR